MSENLSHSMLKILRAKIFKNNFSSIVWNENSVSYKRRPWGEGGVESWWGRLTRRAGAMMGTLSPLFKLFGDGMGTITPSFRFGTWLLPAIKHSLIVNYYRVVRKGANVCDNDW